MLEKLKNIKSVIPLTKDSFLPAFITLIAVIISCLNLSIEPHILSILHFLFFAINLAIFGILLYFNRRGPVFFALIICLSYICINSLKTFFPHNYFYLGAYQNILVLLPLNLIFFYFSKDDKLIKKNNALFLVLIFTEIFIIEHLHVYDFSLNYEFKDFYLSTLLFCACLIIFFITCSFTGKRLSTALFFASVCIFIGIYNVHSSIIMTVLFLSSSLIILSNIITDFYLNYYNDPLTGILSRNSFMIDTKNLPFKYCLGIIAIDDYENLKKIFGRGYINNITKMMALKINEIAAPTQLYRYDEDEFVILFKDTGKKEAFNKLEVIRRAIASSEFLIKNSQNPLKLTISCSISEKKRSDSGSIEVLMRAKKVLQKTYKFTQNVTSQA